MSGICGIIRLDGGAPAPAEIAAMTNVLERRGPDGTHHWIEGQAALGHTLLATTPEALVERLPLTDPASGCTITADVRLDNREELLAALGLDGSERVIGDGELILRSYLEWGEDCPKHLLGDFAFAIWDPRSPQLFCARDHMGMRQLIYHHEAGRHFLFATEPGAILAHPAAPKRLNEGRIADYIDSLESIDFTSTFFEELYRLPPAHSLTIMVGGLSLNRYWELRAKPEQKLGSDKAYADAFMEVFTKAVRCRLRSVGQIGSMLSGGMDSNAVAAVASRLLETEERGPLATFSAVGPDPEQCPETRAIMAAIAASGFAATMIDHSRLEGHRDDLLRLVQHCSEPFDGYMTLVRSVYLSAHRAGLKVMLDGVGGDVVLTAGNRVAQLLRSGRILAAVREARGEKRFWGSAANSTYGFLAAIWTAFVPKWVRAARRRLAWRRQDRQLLLEKQLIDGEFARRADLVARRNRFRAHLGKVNALGPEGRAQSIRHPRLVVARERYDRIASALAIEPRDPFLDVGVVEFCLSLPPSQLQGDGWPKLILRRAMNGLIPPEIIWRRGKEHLGWAFTQALFATVEERQLATGKAGERLSGLVSPTILRAHSAEVDKERQFELFVLACWMARNQARDRSFTRDGEC